jgi:hypothetical protein
MQEFWNFKDFTYIASTHWPWLLLALALGLVVGLVSCRDERP